MTHPTDEGTMIYAAHEERRQLSAGRRDPEQTHSVAHSHTDTQSAKSSRKKTEEEEEEEKVVRDTESLFVLSIPCCFYCYNRPVSQSVSHSRPTQPVAAGELQ